MGAIYPIGNGNDRFGNVAKTGSECGVGMCKS